MITAEKDPEKDALHGDLEKTKLHGGEIEADSEVKEPDGKPKPADG